MNRPVCLTIAGSDPSGGAGIQADLKTFHRHGVYGAAVVSLVTVQNSLGTLSSEVLPADLVEAQARAVLDDLPVACVKTGALGSAAVIEAVARVLSGRSLALVVDPVMSAKNGTSFMVGNALDAAMAHLFPLATLLTPNLDEASAIVGRPLATVSDMQEAALEMRERFGCAAVLVKGGHLAGDDLVDVLCDDRGFAEFEARRIRNPHTRGTGCTYSATLAAHMAQGIGMREAVTKSRAWLQKAIESAPALGHGRGGLDHFA